MAPVPEDIQTMTASVLGILNNEFRPIESHSLAGPMRAIETLVSVV